MRVLITGASGFLGSECLKQFKDHDHKVITTDKTGKVDLTGDLSDAVFADSLPDVDVVVNCAAVQYVTKAIPFFAREKFFTINNVLSAKNLCERYRENNTHFVHVATSMMYRQTGQELYTTKSPMGGEGVYSRSKMAAQTYVEALPKVATVVPCIIGGKGREGLFSQFVSMMMKFGIVVFPGNGNHVVHMVHVLDVASLILRIAETQAVGIYNAAGPDPLSIRQWIDEIKSELGISRVIKLSIPLFPIKCLSKILGYRLLAREQLLMLELPHVLSIRESKAIGWEPVYSNSRIARDIAVHIRNKISSNPLK